MSYSETDLREAFAELALDDGREPDVTELRARLLATTIDHPATSDAEVPAEVIDLDAAPALARRTARRSRLLLLAAAAAIVAGLATLTVVLLPGSPGTVDPADKLREIGGTQFPGTVAVGYVEGRGSQTITSPRRELPPGFVWQVVAHCDGRGKFFVDQAGTTSCRNGTNFGRNLDATTPRVTARIDTSARWQLVWTQTPRSGANGSVSSPVDEDLGGRRPGRGVSAGSGDGTATVPDEPDYSGSPSGSYQVRLTCRGSGIRLPEVRSSDPTNDTGRSGAQTRTCFPGFQYVWQNVTLREGQVLRVVAASGTTWRVAFSRL